MMTASVPLAPPRPMANAAAVVGLRPRVLFVTGSEGFPAGVSGYDRLAEHIPGSVVCGYRRVAGGILRVANPLVRAIAASRWALPATIRNEVQVWRRLRRERFDLVHLLWGERDFGLIDRVARSCRVPLVATFHAPYGREIGPLRRPEALRNLGGLTLVSSTQVDYFSRLLPPGVPRRVVLHGIDTHAFTPAPIGRPGMPFVVGFAGGFRRDFEVLERVIERFADDKAFEFRLLIPAAVRPRFADHPRVRLVAGLSDEQLADFYRQAGCLLMTLEDSTANNAILEAMASGLPVVAEDVGGTREYVTPQAGRLMAKGDVDGLVQSLRTLAADEPLRRQLASAARERALELSWPLVAAHMGEFYREVLARSSFVHA